MHVEDRWTKPGPNGRRIRSDRHGTGKRWLAVWDQPDGRRKRAFTSKEAALAHLRDMELQLSEGTWTTGGDLTLRAYATTWAAQQIHLRPTSRATINARLTRILTDLGGIELQELTRDRIQQAIIRWADSYAPRTVHSYRRTLSQILDAAVEARRLARNPATKLNMPALTGERIEPLTVTQVWAVRDAVHPRYQAMVVLAAATGLRSSEMTGLTSDRIRSGSVKVDRQLATGAPTWRPPKTSKSDRIVSIDGQTFDALRDHMLRYPPHPSGLVFTNKFGRPISRSTMIQAWPDAIGRGWHDLRHFHASLLIRAGLSPAAVADRLGHDNPAITLRVYAHLWEDDDTRAVQAVADGLWPGIKGAVKPPASPHHAPAAGQTG